jgi:hypothetical protein
MPVRTLTHDGVTLTIGEWAARTKQSPQSLRHRLNSGWPVADALSIPPGKRGTTPYSEVADAERQRCERKLKQNAKQIRREFNRLVSDMNRALNAFNTRLTWILNEDDTPGVVSDHSKSASDRMPRVAEECA